jgi:large subunit ribosomal protein L15
MKLKKKRKAVRMRGHGRGTYGWGARKKHISSGNRGGFGMAGTGKTAGHKYSLLQKLYPGQKYLGKQGITSKATKRRKNNVLNVSDLELNFDSLKKKYGEKDGTLNLEDYKILGDGEIGIKVSVKARHASKSAIEKIEKAGGKIVVPGADVLNKKEDKASKAEEKK